MREGKGGGGDGWASHGRGIAGLRVITCGARAPRPVPSGSKAEGPGAAPVAPVAVTVPVCVGEGGYYVTLHYVTRHLVAFPAALCRPDDNS